MKSNNTLSIFGKIRRRLASLPQKLVPLNLKFRNVSYAQSGEDLIIEYIFAQLGVVKPTYIDIGAHHPYYLSNTALFYEKGCRGICVEPDPELFSQFTVHRAKDVNLNCGIGHENGNMDFYFMNVKTMNTFSWEDANALVSDHGFSITQKKTIPVRTLAAVIDQYNGGIFPDLLSLDVEGLDEAIIKSIDFNRFRPMVICLETISFSTRGQGKKNGTIIDYLVDMGYMIYADTNINTIFVLKEKWQR